MKKSFRVLFVCTGNTFRSMAAEYCLKQCLKRHGVRDVVVSSAGIQPRGNMSSITVQELLKRGMDPRRHKKKTITDKLVKSSDIIIALAKNHQRFIQKQFNLNVLLFNQLAYKKKTSVPDINELVKDFKTNKPAVARHIVKTVKHIYKGMPNILRRIQHFKAHRTF